MIAPLVVRNDTTAPQRQAIKRELSTDRIFERAWLAVSFLASGWGWKEAPFSSANPATAVCPRGWHDTGDEGKAAGCVPLAALLFVQALNTRSAKPHSQSA
jgi:hypothetical protein